MENPLAFTSTFSYDGRAAEFAFFHNFLRSIILSKMSWNSLSTPSPVAADVS
jgi:hypothetical protein